MTNIGRKKKKTETERSGKEIESRKRSDRKVGRQKEKKKSKPKERRKAEEKKKNKRKQKEIMEYVNTEGTKIKKKIRKPKKKK